MRSTLKDRRLISIWLFAGVVMVFFQILLGGVTRLTGSGLSITKWDIVTGTLPPLDQSEWEESFALYRATPQYEKINRGMSLSEYKFIFFWEYIHRLWARVMGFVFAIPFLFFLFRGSLSRWLLGRLAVVIFLAALAATFGWIMVASGLIDRPWVNAYKLAIHLGLGILLFIYLFLTWLTYRGFSEITVNDRKTSVLLVALIMLVIIQIGFGGILSGMKAAMNYPTWPLMRGDYVPDEILIAENWNRSNFLFYDRSSFMPALIQFTHRNTAYVIAILVVVFSLKWMRNVPGFRWIGVALIGIIVVQLWLGIMVLLCSIGSIPVSYGALHQGLGIVFLTFLVYINKRSKR